MSEVSIQSKNAAFGIDHPLIAVHHIERLRECLLALGFNMTPIGKHPWGTSTSLAIFKGCLLEIMGIYDDSLLDEHAAGNFRFGRHVHTHLMEREGIALTALHSVDTALDAISAEASGLNISGHLEFGRDVTLPDGRPDRTKTSLALMPDAEFPRLSFFLCQQHRRDLIEVAQWMEHPNSVCGINNITIKACAEHQSKLRTKLEALYGDAIHIKEGFLVHTANGTISVQTENAIVNELGPLPDAVLTDNQPAIVGIELCCTDLTAVTDFVKSNSMTYTLSDNVLRLNDAKLIGNTLLQFRACT